MLLGIGIDLLSLARLEGVVARRGAAALAKRICSPREYTEFSSIAPDQHLKYLSSRYVYPFSFSLDQPMRVEIISATANPICQRLMIR